ncbi:hypothetical protein Pcinc_030829 [Petrolisthes cinctipes]|uniref:Transmembrane protein 45B n=1 Tax=Petrolisthes cinctipes TaxID=88211 RepID=A0AAE1EXY1_PETCI|nr:hypothetical protein Pcinc_030829 [Petrolisthes cinctipes]
MGSLVGHVVPGVLTVIIGVWWTFSILRRYYLCVRAAGGGGVEGVSGTGASLYRNTSSFPCPCVSRLPVEGLIKVTIVIIGVIGELTTAYENGEIVNLVNIQHITIYTFFGLNGVMDVLCHYRAPLPPSMDYISGGLAFTMEGLVFIYHLHARTPMDVQVHMLLVYAVWGCVVAVIAEGVYRSSVVVALTRCYFVLLQGTWLIYVGFLLYPPTGMEKWDEHGPRNMMIVTVIFCCHNALIFLFMLTVNWAMYLLTRRLPPHSLYRAIRAVHTPQQFDDLKIDVQNFIEL